jgi:hypothetical protein
MSDQKEKIYLRGIDHNPARAKQVINSLRNHEPHQQGIWFDYTRFRYKDMYDIKLHDGRIIEHMRPNGNSWYGSETIRDEQVAQVRLKPDNEIDDGYHMTGQKRIDYQVNLFRRNTDQPEGRGDD